MAIDQTLLTLALELAADYDDDLDTAEGSAFRTQFLDPLLERVGGSPLEVDLESFLVSRIEEELPDVDVSAWSGLRDLLIRVASVILEPLRREIRALRIGQSMANWRLMTRGEVNALLANYFTSLRDGEIALVSVRLYYTAPQSVLVTATHQFSTSSGLNFFPTEPQSISASQMSFNQEGDLYYMDVSLQSEGTGEAYNIGANEINTVIGLSGVYRAVNLKPAQYGTWDETKLEGIVRARNSITIRNLITRRGAEFVIPENFPTIDTLEVIGFGDDEMARDIVRGPVTISDIPGGLAGIDDPSLGAGAQIHIGGKVDLYVYQSVLEEEELDIENLTDKGMRIARGVHGYTALGPPTDTFSDEYGFFVTKGVTTNDVLLIGSSPFVVSMVVDETTIQVFTSNIPGGLYAASYDIVRQDTNQITVPLYDLIAEEDGEFLLDTDGDPVEPLSGDLENAPLYSGGVLVKKTENVALANVQRPLLRIKTIEFLDPLTLEGSGVYIPMRDVLFTQATEEFTGGGVGTRAVGTVRVWFRDQVNAWVTRASTRFIYGALSFRPVTEPDSTSEGSAALGTVGTSIITLLNGDFTATAGYFDVGYRIEITTGVATGTYTVIGGASVGPNTELTIRETLPATFVGGTWRLHVGIAESNIDQDAVSGLYYFDVAVEAINTGAAGNLDAATTLGHQNVTPEGWTLKTTSAVLSFSTKELPYLQVSAWVNDTTEVLVAFTAPAVRVTYEYAPLLVDIQEFVDDPDNRIVATDVLVRHFLPAYIRMSVAETGLDSDQAEEALAEYLRNLAPTDDLEVSDLVHLLYQQGATYVQMPLTVVRLSQDTARGWSGDHVQDSDTSSRVQHYLPDLAHIEVTEV